MGMETLTIRPEVVNALGDLRKKFADIENPILNTEKIHDFFDAIESYLALKDPSRPARPKSDRFLMYVPPNHRERIVEKGYFYEDLDKEYPFFAQFSDNEIDYLKSEVLKFKPAET